MLSLRLSWLGIYNPLYTTALIWFLFLFIRLCWQNFQFYLRNLNFVCSKLLLWNVPRALTDFSKTAILLLRTAVFKQSARNCWTLNTPHPLRESLKNAERKECHCSSWEVTVVGSLFVFVFLCLFCLLHVIYLLPIVLCGCNLGQEYTNIQPYFFFSADTVGIFC